MRYFGFLLFTVAIVIVPGCGSREVGDIVLQEKVLARPNPTSYEFNASVGNMKEAIKRAVERHRDADLKKYQNRVWKGRVDADTQHSLSVTLQGSVLGLLFWKGESDVLANGIFTKPENENDAYINGRNSPVGESQIYFKDGEPLIYFADFHIHLTVIEPEKTRVDIITYDSSIVAGLEKTWSGHGPRFISIKVPPTTIEEYRILRGIGEELGVQNMPPLATPGPDSPIKQITKSRR